jgi:S-(hydroxymethyl)mycothiol dehydrogenase
VHPGDPAAEPEAAGLLGCGVMAGLGAAMLTGEVQPWRLRGRVRLRRRGRRRHRRRPLAGATTIVAVDLDDRKLEWAKELRRHPHRERLDRGSRRGVRALTGGNGADVCIEAVGNPKVFEQAFFARDLAGTVVQVGVPTRHDLELPMIEFFGRGGRSSRQLVRRLPAAATSRCSSTCTCRAG